jgi:hypothetical protein
MNRAHALRRVLGVALLLAGSCYNPNFGQVLYKCGLPNKTCPDGLMCIDGKHCTYSTPACDQGGILISTGTYVCPGDNNGCGPGFNQCTAVTNLCKLDILDSGYAEKCTICCADYGDMAPKGLPAG